MYRATEFLALLLLGDDELRDRDGAHGNDEEGGSSSLSKAAQPRALQQLNGKEKVDIALKWAEEAGVTGEFG